MKTELKKIIAHAMREAFVNDEVTTDELLIEAIDKVEKLYSSEILTLNGKIDFLTQELSLKN